MTHVLYALYMDQLQCYSTTYKFTCVFHIREIKSKGHPTTGPGGTRGSG